LIQYFVYVIVYQRFIEDKIMNFIDLCSVCNISLFILDKSHHGYYIHGRSPHGITDVNIKDMIVNLQREAQSMTGTRGLQGNSTEQIFILKIDRAFRRQYESLFRNYYVSQSSCWMKFSVLRCSASPRITLAFDERIEQVIGVSTFSWNPIKISTDFSVPSSITRCHGTLTAFAAGIFSDVC
jgi:Meckelin (Transmembrane protein 67)